MGCREEFLWGLADDDWSYINQKLVGVLKRVLKKFGEGLAGATPVGFAIKYGGEIVNAGKKGWQDGKDPFNKKMKPYKVTIRYYTRNVTRN